MRSKDMREGILKALKAVNGDGDFENSRDFIEDGLLDSFEIVNLVSELEDIFSLEIRGADILPENFINLEAITRLLQGYKE
jgi:acyl carrier protein